MARARLLGWAVLLTFALLVAPRASAGLYVSNANDATVSPFSFNADGSLSPIACPSACAIGGTDHEGTAINPSGRFLYVTTGTPGRVSVFSIGAGGALAPVTCGGCATPDNTVGIAIPPSGRFLYTTSASPSNVVTVFAVAADGTLSPVPCGGCATGNDPAGVAIDPSGHFLYVANDGADSVSVFSVQADGSLVPVTCNPATNCHTGSGPNGVKVSPGGGFVYVTNIGAGSVSVFAMGASGALTPVPCDPSTSCHTGSNPNDLAIDPSGHFLYASNYGGNSVSAFAIGADGSLTPIACAPLSTCATGMGPDGIALDASGRFLYTANGASNSVSVFKINSNGTIEPVPCDPGTSCKTGAGPNFQSVAIPPDQAPIAALSAAAGRAGQVTSFDARGSTDVDDAVVRYDWSFGDGTAAPNAGPTPQHVYTKPGAYTASVTVIDASGCSTAQVFTGQVVLCNGGPAATRSATVQVSPVRPLVSGLSQSARRWREGKALPKIARKRRLPLGTRFRFRLNETARVQFKFTQRKAGRRVGRRCVPLTKKNRARRPCKRTVTAGRLSFAGKAGANSVRFQGRISRRVRLRPGRYTLVVTASVAGAPTSAGRSISFTIVK